MCRYSQGYFDISVVDVNRSKRYNDLCLLDGIKKNVVVSCGTTGVESVKVDQSVCKYVHYGLDGRMVQRNHKRVTAQTGMTSVGVVMWYNG